MQTSDASCSEGGRHRFDSAGNEASLKLLSPLTRDVGEQEARGPSDRSNAHPGIPARTGWNPEILFSMVMLGVFVGYVSGLAMLFEGHGWILTPHNRPVPCDFLAYWVAGSLARIGHAATAYDPRTFHAAQLVVAGRFREYLYWNYPPHFFFVAMFLSSIPYVWSFLGWVVTTGSAYALTIGTIVRRWAGSLAACASPVVLLAAFSGQNGFLSAALLGGSLLLLPVRPLVAGFLVGLMAYKPQLGLLIPVALVCGGYWRALWSATATVAVFAGAAAFVFGSGIYGSFLHSLPVVSHTSLTLGGEGWFKMQSIYAIARLVGAGDGAAWAGQLAVTSACIVTVALFWRSALCFELKAAVLPLAALLSTPYVHIYDLPILLVSAAFLYRQRPFDGVEWSACILLTFLLLVCVFRLAPIGPGLVAILLVLIALRTLRRTTEQGIIPMAPTHQLPAN